MAKGSPGLVGGSIAKNSLSELFSILKGGSGSGNFGHKGRKGIRGGSASGNTPQGEISYNYNGIKIVGKPSLSDFLTAWKWEKTGTDTNGIPVHLSPDTLPPVKPGETRFAHGTPFRNIDSITKNGLKSGRNAGLGEQIDVILGVKANKSGFGNTNVVFDLPNSSEGKEWRSVNDEWVEFNRTITPKEIKGIVVTKIPVDLDEFGEALADYRQRYGEP